jgi:putative peptidoglycan lipid II flippase
LPLQALFRGGEALLPLVLAAWFGRTSDTDLYYLLAAYFVFASSIITGAFQDSAMVPVLVELEATVPEAAARVVGSLLGHTLAAGAAVAVLAGAVATFVALMSSEARAIPLVLLMSIGLALSSVRAFYVGLLNSREQFSAHPVASGLGMGLSVVVLSSGRHALGIIVIPLATLAGEATAVVLLATYAGRVLGFRVRPHLERSEPVRRIFAMVGLEVTGSVVTRINPVIDQLMSRLGGVLGGGTLLLCANNVASLPTSILQATLFPVLLTRLSEEAPTKGFLRTTKLTVGAVTLVLSLVSALLFAFRLPLVRLLFLHGAMDAAGVGEIVDVVPWALAGVVPFGVLLVLARAHVARQNSRIMPSMGLLNASCNALFNLVFVGHFGLAGIALSTSVTYVVVAIVFWIRLPRCPPHSNSPTTVDVESGFP